MRISRHIEIVDSREGTVFCELKFEEPVDLSTLVGDVDQIYTGLNSEDAVVSENRITVFSKNGFLQITELMRAGDTLSIEIRKGYRLRKIVLDPVHSLQMLASDQTLVYWFNIGRDGIFGKLKAGLSDPLLRDYYVRRCLSSPDIAMLKFDEFPERMKHKEAAKYLRVSASSLYEKVAAGTIKRRRGNIYLKEDLDEYVRSGRGY